MIRISMAMACLALLSSTARAAPFVSLDGRVADVVDGVFEVVVEVRDDDGDVRLSATESGVIVVDGVFAIDLDVAEIAADLTNGAVMTVDVELGALTATTRLGAMFSAASATTATTATKTTTASSLGAIAPASLIQFETLDDASGVVVAFANVVGVPPGVADGVDNGTIVDFSGGGIVISGGTLRLTTVTGPQILNGSVPSAAIANATLTTTQIAGLTAADFADSTLLGVDVADGAMANINEINAPAPVAIFEQNAACDAGGGPERLVLGGSCLRRSCGSGRVVCGTSSTCENPSTGSFGCVNTRLGFLLFGPP